MKVLLKKDTPKVGKKHEVVEVSDGYAQNFLIPQGVAEFATERALKAADEMRARAEADRAEREAAIKKELAALKSSTVAMTARANEKGKLFASIEREDICDALKGSNGLDLDPEHIMLQEPIKTTGEHTVSVHVGDSVAEITVSVTAE